METQTNTNETKRQEIKKALALLTSISRETIFNDNDKEDFVYTFRIRKEVLKW